MEIKLIDIDKIKPYKNNPRNNENSIKNVANSIKEFGFKVPITVDKNYIIITGHTRYEASKLLKLKKVPCIIIKDLDDNKIKAFRLIDNKTSEYALWNIKKLKNELNAIDYKHKLLFDFLNEENIDILEQEELNNLVEELYVDKKVVICECPFCHRTANIEEFK